MSKATLPLIGLPACVIQAEGMPFHKVGDKYVRAVAVGAGGLPIMIPSLGDLIDLEDLVERLDGLVMTGSPSNVFPAHYREEPHPDAEPHDHWRDETTLPLIKLEKVVVMGRGDVKKALKVRVHRVTKGAREKIEAAGGSVEIIEE